MNAIQCEYCNEPIYLAALPLFNHYFDSHKNTGSKAIEMTKHAIKNIKKIDRVLADDLKRDLEYITLLLNLEK